MLDVTAQKDAESKAEEAEIRFRTLTERGPAVIYSSAGLPRERRATVPRFDLHQPQAVELVGYPVDHWRNEAESGSR